MELRQLILGDRAAAEGGDLRHVFTPAGAEAGEKGSVLATFKGFGKNGWGREQFLGAAERFNLISAEQRAAAGAGAGAGELSDALAAGPRAAFASGAAGAGAVVSDNPIYGGLYAQRLMREQGFQIPVSRVEHLPEGAMASAADEVVDAAVPAATETVATVTDDAAARMAQLEQQFIERFQRLAQLPAEQQIPALARAVDLGAAAGHGDDAFGVLASTLAARPLEHSIGALDGSIDEALRAAAPKAAAVAEQAAPVADEAATKVVKAAAPVADHPLIVAARAQLADDLASGTLTHIDEAFTPLLNTKLGAIQLVAKTDLAAALGHAAPVADEVVKAAPIVERVVEKAVPVLDQAVLPVADDALRNGLRGAMSFSAGLDDTLRLLAKFR